MTYQLHTVRDDKIYRLSADDEGVTVEVGCFTGLFTRVEALELAIRLTELASRIRH